MLQWAKPGATLLLNSPYDADQVWEHLPKTVQQQLIDRKIKFFVIDADKVARESGMGTRTNTIMQTCFFAISGVLDKAAAIEKIKYSIKKTYGKKGDEVVRKNFEAVDHTIAHLHEVKVPERATSVIEMLAVVPKQAPEFVQKVTAMMMAGRGDELPVSALPIDGTYPSGTTKWEKRNISQFVPIWEPEICIQCGNCSFVCPHGVIRSKLYDKSLLDDAPASFKSAPIDARGFPDTRYTLQIYVEDCTGCTLVRRGLPGQEQGGDRQEGDQHGAEGADPRQRHRERRLLRDPAGQRALLRRLLDRPRHPVPRAAVRVLRRVCRLRRDALRQAGLAAVRRPDDGGECHRLLVDLRRQPADHAVDGQRRGARPVVVELAVRGQRRVRPRHAARRRPPHAAGAEPADRDGERHRRRAGRGASSPPSSGPESEIRRQRVRRGRAQEAPRRSKGTLAAKQLLSVADHLVRRSVWIVGGDGWAYDIGSGGVDHVLATGRDVNVLVLDTEVYSNTGGQASKSTPIGAVAKFANAGKQVGKKDMALQAISYGNVYVARVAMGANPQQTLLAFREAEAYRGPSLILAYSHCIAHGINMQKGLDQQSRAVHSGYWPLVRYNPEVRQAGENPFVLDSPRPSLKFRDYADNELRYRMLRLTNPKEADRLMQMAQASVDRKWKLYEEMATQG